MLSINKGINDELFSNFINRFEFQSLLKLWRMKTTRKAESDIIGSISIISHPEFCRDRMDTGSSATSYIMNEREREREEERWRQSWGKEELYSRDYLAVTKGVTVC